MRGGGPYFGAQAGALEFPVASSTLRSSSSQSGGQSKFWSERKLFFLEGVPEEINTPDVVEIDQGNVRLSQGLGRGKGFGRPCRIPSIGWIAHFQLGLHLPVLHELEG